MAGQYLSINGINVVISNGSNINNGVNGVASIMAAANGGNNMASKENNQLEMAYQPNENRKSKA